MVDILDCSLYGDCSVRRRATSAGSVEFSDQQGEGRRRGIAGRRANLFNIDAAVQGANFGVNIMKPAGAFDPAEQALILEEVKNPKVWFGDKFGQYPGPGLIKSAR